MGKNSSTIKSQFSTAAYLIIAGIVLIIPTGVFKIISDSKDPFFGGLWMLGSIISLMWLIIYIVWWEARNKIIIVKLEDEKVTVTSLGITKSYNLKDFDGFKAGTIPYRHKDHEQFYLYQNGRRVILLSSFYLKNYTDLKRYISQRSTYLGNEQYSFVKEFIKGFKY